MRIPSPPKELFAIATNVSEDIFVIDSITMIDSDEFQLMLKFVKESELYVAVHFKTTCGQPPRIFYWFGESYESNTSGSFSDQFMKWVAEIS
jgi:hypothetical protein